MKSPGKPASNKVQTEDYTALLSILEVRQYKEAEKILYEAQRQAHAREEGALFNLLTAAHQICLACQDHQVEIASFKQAYETAVAREHSLRGQLLTLIKEVVKLKAQLSTMELTDPQEERLIGKDTGAERKKIEGLPIKLWHRLRHMLQQASITALSEPARAGKLPQMEKDSFPKLPDEQTEPSLVIYCLGQFRVYLNGKEIIEWCSGKAKAIFKYIVANHDRPVPKTILMDTFWPANDFEAARNNLNVAVYSLRKTFKATQQNFDYILFQNDHYLLNPMLTLWIDFREFLTRFMTGQRLEREGRSAEAVTEYVEAQKLYRGDFLEEDLYEDWLIPTKEGLRDNSLIISERLGKFYLENNMYQRCIRQCQFILTKDNCREDAHRRLMRCYYLQGKRNQAIKQYQRCVDALSEVLDVPPMPDTAALYELIRKGDL